MPESMMHPMTLVMIGLLILIVVVGAIFVVLRVYAGREVESDHPRHPEP